MNISPDGVTLYFKTAPEELFLAEKSGTKPNLLCLMDFDEWTLLKKHNPTKIIIQHQQEIFLRTLTNIHLEGEMLNTWVVTFSWQHPQKHPESDHVHVMTAPDLSHSVSVEQGDHSVGLQQEAKPSIDERFAAITISNCTLTLLQSIAHGRTMDMVIQELYERYMFQRAEERGPLHD